MKPTIGRIVHFVKERDPRVGPGTVQLPAIVTAVWSDNCVNLQVFTDGTNSHPDEHLGQVEWVTSVLLDSSEGPEPRTWHWPEREG